jgi:uncharacterized protein (TIGR00255 family)
MTGYGKATGQVGNKKFNIELKSLNSKQLDLNVKIPSLYSSKEIELRNQLATSIVRGKVTVSVFYESDAVEKQYTINSELVNTYQATLKKVASQIGEDDSKLLSHILKMPDVLNTQKAELDENEWKQVNELVKLATTDFIDFRVREGQVLKEDAALRIGLIQTYLEQILAIEGKRIERVKERIEAKLAEVADKMDLDKNRLEQEIIYFLEKLDITEEKVRLKAHCDYFVEVLNSDNSEGKKLGFISQEIGREINTIGSKSNDADMQKIVVQMKDELEKIKEQLLNVL